MPLITLNQLDYSVGGPLLLERVQFAIEPAERIALIGRNGAGKSTLLKLLAGELRPDDGEVRVQNGVRIARLEQEVPPGAEGAVFDVVADGLGSVGADLALFHRLSHADQIDADALASVQARIEAAQGWDADRRVADTLALLELDGDVPFARLSGGLKRRVLLARALVSAPDLLLLDEPTNHLDIDAIDWLEKFLKSWRGALVFITHDRRFLRALATRIVEIDRGKLTSWPGDFDNYLRRREERLHAESVQNAQFDTFLAEEEVWIRQGIKARRTRNEGRVRRLEALRRERAQRREVQGRVRLELGEAAASGKKVLEARNVDFSFEGKPILRDFSTTVLRGDRIGLIGPNGAGKSTLIRLLLGELAPQRGEILRGTNLSVAYFDQYRATLREDWNALDNVSEGREFIEINGKRKHVLGYLQDFLFTPERARAPITRLSGGERNRLLLAKLFAQPANLLVMDEPTNDLDVETLELLEELLAEYAGTLILVSHDREFLDNVVTSTLVMEGQGRVGEYVGGYADWLRQRAQGASPKPAPEPAAAVSVPPPAKRAAKLSYKDQRELEMLPGRIEALEAQIQAQTDAMNAPGFFQRDAAAIVAHQQAIAQVQVELEACYARWETLESGG
ncbi:ATP-binding cassette domain-containing protein [Xanthomonadaceae bacterium JHOS43]|nr:ATP-binding cassette domain-containing protein [Xanthomonadaceae bacterium JHOS43]MCX7564151.1 ATP-binding cassette domain-containing protein [Xanthomonadaceae bacterium XH05]